MKQYQIVHIVYISFNFFSICVQINIKSVFLLKIIQNHDIIKATMRRE